MVMRRIIFIVSIALLLVVLAPAVAIDQLEVTRQDDAKIVVRWQDTDPVDMYLSATPKEGDTVFGVLVSASRVSRGHSIECPLRVETEVDRV